MIEGKRTLWESMKLVVVVALCIALGLTVLFLAIYLVGLLGALLFWIHPIVGNIYLGILGLLFFTFVILALVDEI